MPLGLDYGLIAALCWGSTDVMATVGSRRLGSLPVAAIAQGTSLLVAILLAIALGETLPTDPGTLLQSLFFGAVAAGAYLSFFTALRIGPLAVVSPVVAAYGGLTVVLAVILRGESLTPLQGFGAALATAGVVLTGVVFDGGIRGTRIVGRGVVLSLVAMLLFTILTVGLATPIRAAGWMPVVLASRLANAATVWLVLGVLLAVRSRRTAALLAGSSAGAATSPTRAAGAASLAGLLDVVGVFAFAIGLEVAPTWIVGLASSFGPVVAVIAAVTFWRERLRPSQWVGLAGIMAGLVAVALP
ncbi:MAG TPA: DMT family transporter [Candidatus Limnocylindrales bacterium]|nr:DMT family transporter [Candidatus Limnocylindrales bacterium]